MIQTGGMTESNGSIQEKREGAFPSIKNESGNGLSNIRGTIAMARTRSLNSATSQFYINHGDNSGSLDPGRYAVFGKVIDGMSVVDAIALMPTNGKDGTPLPDLPNKSILLKSAKRKS